MKNILILLFFLIFTISCDYLLSKTLLPVNKLSYMYGFNKFYTHAKRTKGEKRIILVGGSSLGWGVSAENLTKGLGIKVLNSGIHAGMGLRYFMKSIEGVLDKKRDLLVVSPEYDIIGQREGFLRTNEFCYVSLFVAKTYSLECIGYSLSSLFRITPIIDQVTSHYKASGFNVYGDYTFRVNGINMGGKFNKLDVCSSISLEDLNGNYIPYLNQIKERGFRIIYVPNFIPANACKNNGVLSLFDEIMHEKFGVDGAVRGSLVFEDKYFYDTHYHLTLDGVKLKTSIFLNYLNRYLEVFESKVNISSM